MLSSPLPLHTHTPSRPGVDLFALSHPDGKGKGKSSGNPMEQCLPNLSVWKRAGSRRQSRHDAGLVQTLIYPWDMCTLQMRMDLAINGYKNSRAMTNQSQLLREAVALGIILKQAKMGPCSCIKHEMRSDDWQGRAGRKNVGMWNSYRIARLEETLNIIESAQDVSTILW